MTASLTETVDINRMVRQCYSDSPKADQKGGERAELNALLELRN